MDSTFDNEDIEDDSSETDLLSAVVDEISLEGLDGITLPSLWIRLRVRYEASDGQPDKRMDFGSAQVHSFIFNQVIKDLTSDSTLSMHTLPVNRPTIQLYNRYEFINDETGTVMEDPDLVPEDIYGEVTPINDGNIRGSSLYYEQRKDVTKDVLDNNMTIEDIDGKYGLGKFVLVAGQTYRTRALMGAFSPSNIELTPIHYCILERIGRQRYLGEITIGKEAGNYKQSPKTLFYYRKLLLKKKLVHKKQSIVFNVKTVQNAHGLVFTLTRFTSELQTKTEMNAKRVNDMLLASDSKEIDYDQTRAAMEMKGRSFRQLICNYSDNFKVIPKPEESNKNKRIIKLLKQICSEDVDETEVNEDNDDDEEIAISNTKGQAIEVFNPGVILADRPLLSQALNVIESHETRDGISFKELGRCLSLPKLETRSLMRYLERCGAISSVIMDRGRQKVTLFTPKWRTDTALIGRPQISDATCRGLREANTTMTNRVNIILDLVRKLQLVDRIFTFKQLIRESEKTNQHKCCSQTVARIVNKLAAQGLVNSIKTVLKHDHMTKKLHFVCLPSITANHPLVKEKINEMRFQWVGKKDYDIQSDKSVSYADSKPHCLTENWPKNNVVMNLIYQPSIARKYGLEPKMKKILTLYRYLFYLTHAYDPKHKKNFPATDWRYNIEPLSETIDPSQANVCTIGQIMPRMPLSTFVKIVWISHIIPGLQELIDDPVKVNQSLSQLSPVILECLRFKRKFIFNICESLVGLSYLGLVETQYKEQTEKEKTIITVKNKFSIITNKIQTDFEMKTMKDVEDFEEALQMHCYETCSDCSLDDRLFAHNLRNWTYTHSYKDKGKNLMVTHRLQKISGTDVSAGVTDNKQKENKTKRKRQSSVSSKKSKKRKTSESKSENKTPSCSQPVTANTNTNTNTNTTPALSTSKKRKQRKKHYDKVDLVARSLLKKQRTDWTPEEDSFLLICRVVSALLDPHSPHIICVDKRIIRDELHKYYPKVSNDKTALACGRRIHYMLKNPTTRQNVNDYVGEFKQQLTITRPNVPRTQEEVWSEAYLELLHEVLSRMQSSRQRSEDNRFAIHFSSLEELLTKYNVINTAASVVPIRGRFHEEPNNVVDIHVNVVTNVLLSSLLSKIYLNQSVDTEEENFFSQTLFKIYQKYPDSLIRSVVTKLNKYGIMTKMKTTKESCALKTKKSPPYRISQNFLFLMQTKFCLESLLTEQTLNEDVICIRDGKSGFEAAIVTSLLASNAVTFNTEVPDNIVVLENDCPLITSARSSPKNPMDPKTASRYALHLLRQHMHSNASDRILHSADYLNVNQCRITCSATDPFVMNISRFDSLFKTQKEVFTKELGPGGVKYYNSGHKQLLEHILQKRELGASIDEMLAIKPMPELEEALRRMTEKKLIFRVGIRSFRWVSCDYVTPWLVRSTSLPNSDKTNSDQNFIKFFARYWKQPNGAVDVKVLFKFLCAVLGHIMTNPCIPETKLIEYFEQSLQPVQLSELIELLSSVQCIEVYESPQISKPSLFDTKLEFTNCMIKHFNCTADSLIRLYRLKQFFKIS